MLIRARFLQLSQSRGDFGWKKARCAIGSPSASSLTVNDPGILSRSMPLTRTETGAERLIENVRAASTLPTLFSSTPSIPSSSYEIPPYEIVSPAFVVVNGGWAPDTGSATGSDNQPASPSIVDWKPVSVVARSLCCHFHQRRSILV